MHNGEGEDEKKKWVSDRKKQRDVSRKRQVHSSSYDNEYFNKRKKQYESNNPEQGSSLC